MNISKPGIAAEPHSKETLRLWLRLLRLNRRIESALRERLRVHFDTTLPRFDIMAALYRNPDGLRMSQLSTLLMVSNGNVTGIVDRLADSGLLLREAVPEDRRAAQVRLTRKGLAEFEKQAAAHEEWVSELLGTLDQGQASNLSELLHLASDGDHDGQHNAQ